MEKFDKFAVVDLGQLSKTKFGNSVTHASILRGGDSLILRVDTGVIKKDLRISESHVAGSYIIYDENGSLMGSTETEFKLNEEL